MPLPAWAADTVTIITPSWRTERGKQIPDYDNPAAVREINGCSVQPAGTDETLAARQATTVRLTVYLPADTVVDAHDAVVVRGTRYHADGAGEQWRSPTGALNHTIVNLFDWEG